MEFISDRVSTEHTDSKFSVVIGARISGLKMALLWGWLLAWSLCGVYFFTELSRTPPGDLKAALIVLLAFWAYFAFRTARTAYWRAKGFELWKLDNDELTVKNSLYGYGKASSYFVANIQRFGMLNMEETSWKWQMSDSFWTRGAERIGFEYNGKKIAIGRGLTDPEAEKLARVMAQELRKVRKAGA